MSARPLAGLDRASSDGILRAVASISANVPSATDDAETAGVFMTVTPSSPAAGRSTLSVPVPQIEMSRRPGSSAIKSRVKRVRPRILTTTGAPRIRQQLSREPASLV